MLTVNGIEYRDIIYRDHFETRETDRRNIEEYFNFQAVNEKDVAGVRVPENRVSNIRYYCVYL